MKSLFVRLLKIIIISLTKSQGWTLHNHQKKLTVLNRRLNCPDKSLSTRLVASITMLISR